MTWSTVGWILIGLAAVLLLTLSWLVKPESYPLRRRSFFQHLTRSRAATIEQGRRQQVVLGSTLWSRAYPGLGLASLAGVSSLLDPETLAEGNTTVSATAGTLAVFANQIIHGRYQDGFSERLLESPVRATVYGPTHFSFAAGLMSDLKMRPFGTMVLLGNFGPESAISVKIIQDQEGNAFAAAGTITSQAALFLNVEDILLGEEVYLLPALPAPNQTRNAPALTEDLLRGVLVLAMVVGAVLKALGVL